MVLMNILGKKRLFALLFFLVVLSFSLLFSTSYFSEECSIKAEQDENVQWSVSQTPITPQLVVCVRRNTPEVIVRTIDNVGTNDNRDGMRFVIAEGILGIRRYDSRKGKFGVSRIYSQSLCLRDGQITIGKQSLSIAELPGLAWNLVGRADGNVYVARNLSMVTEEFPNGKNQVDCWKWSNSSKAMIIGSLSDEFLNTAYFQSHASGVEIVALRETNDLVLCGENGQPYRIRNVDIQSPFDGPTNPHGYIFADDRFNVLGSISQWNDTWQLVVWDLNAGTQLRRNEYSDGLRFDVHTKPRGVFLSTFICLTYTKQKILLWDYSKSNVEPNEVVDAQGLGDIQVDSILRVSDQEALVIGYTSQVDRQGKHRAKWYLNTIDSREEISMDIRNWFAVNDSTTRFPLKKIDPKE